MIAYASPGADDIIWIFCCLMLTALMQPLFAWCKTSATSPILLNTIASVATNLVAWICFGYTLAFGEDRWGFAGRNSFIFAGGPFAETPRQSDVKAFLGYLYQWWTFAAACTTIILGAVAYCVPFEMYLAYVVLKYVILYRVLARWVRTDEGWASATRNNPIFEVLDFAGSGVVHMFGGAVGLIKASYIGPRRFRPLPANHPKIYTTEFFPAKHAKQRMVDVIHKKCGHFRRSTPRTYRIFGSKKHGRSGHFFSVGA